MEEEVGEFTTYHHYPQLDIYENEGITGHVNECEHTEQDKKLIEDMKKDPSKIGEVLISEEHRTRNLVRELRDHINEDLIKELKDALKKEVDEELKRIREDAAQKIEDSRKQLEAVQNQLTLMPTQQQMEDLQKLFKSQTEESLKVVKDTLERGIKEAKKSRKRKHRHHTPDCKDDVSKKGEGGDDDDKDGSFVNLEILTMSIEIRICSY